jgi:hypothetical protein
MIILLEYPIHTPSDFLQLAIRINAFRREDTPYLQPKMNL